MLLLVTKYNFMATVAVAVAATMLMAVVMPKMTNKQSDTSSLHN